MRRVGHDGDSIILVEIILESAPQLIIQGSNNWVDKWNLVAILAFAASGATIINHVWHYVFHFMQGVRSLSAVPLKNSSSSQSLQSR